MTGSVLLDVAIGVIFALLTFSLIASALQEAIASVLNWRGRMLRVSIRRLLANDLLGDAVMGHGLIKGLHGPGSRLAKLGTGAAERFPSSIPAAVFAKSFIETLLDQYGEFKESKSSADDALEAVRKMIDKIEIDKRLKSRLKEYIGTAAKIIEALDGASGALGKVEERIDAARAELVATVEALQAEIEIWFDQAMDRVIGWYVRRTKYVLFAIGFAMAMATNFNLLGYAGDLLRNDELRARMVARAELMAGIGSLDGREVGGVGFGAAAVWLNAAGADNVVSQDEIDELLGNASLGAIARAAADADGNDEVTLEEAQAAFDRAWEKLEPFDEDGDGVLSEAEADKAADASLSNLGNEIVRSLETLNRELGEQGVSLGRACKENESIIGCFWSAVSWAALLSWLMVGLGCTLGGQFWYDMLRNLLKVRTAAAGTKTGAEKQPTS